MNKTSNIKQEHSKELHTLLWYMLNWVLDWWLNEHHAAKHRSTYVRRPATSEAHGYKDTLAGCQIGLLENIFVLKYLQVPCHIETTNYNNAECWKCRDKRACIREICHNVKCPFATQRTELLCVSYCRVRAPFECYCIALALNNVHIVRHCSVIIVLQTPVGHSVL